MPFIILQIPAKKYPVCRVVFYLIAIATVYVYYKITHTKIQ
ncbi:MAG: hypothetical protein ACD_81C00217G0012 [uncultured bacterium]|nr:MAG: hypothetical protein ACD_81C00217G0012 [uncultured bacterium]